MINFLTQLNWVDVVVVLLFVRICFTAIKGTLFAEFFKLIAVISATYFSLHYFTSLADLIIENTSGKDMPNAPVELVDFIVFCLLAAAGYLLFVFLREALHRVIKMQPLPDLDRWGGLVLGGIRGVLLISLLMFMLCMSSIEYLQRSVGTSYLGRRLFTVAPSLYSGIWNGVISKFNSKEEFNSAVSEVGALQEQD